MHDGHFANLAINYFEKVNKNENTYLIDMDNITEFKHIKYIGDNIYSYKRGSVWIRNFIEKNTTEIDKVIVHHLTYYRAHLINTYLGNKNITWIFFGSDVYESFREFEYLTYKYETRKITHYLRYKDKLRLLLRPSFFKLKYPFQNWNFSKYQAIKKINCFANTDKSAYEVIKRKLPIKADWKWFTFYSVNDIKKPDNFVLGNYILIGNSSTALNNHIDLFKDLISLDFKIQCEKYIVPLSYGNSYFKKKVNIFGKKILKDKFFPLNNFLPFDEYNNILSSCSVIIMNHLRPQATGNIVTGLFLGARVFLDENNPLFKYFSNLGLIIFSVNKDLHLLKDMSPLDTISAKTNRIVIESLYNEQNILDGIKQIIQ